MIDEELILRLNSLYCMLEEEGHYTKANTADFAATRIKTLIKREQQLWDLLEEIDAQIDLAEEINEEFAEKVRVAIWENGE